ncbi:Rpn family recombination-promoting nuclease/putative transposase [Halorhodospira neutriphila]|uniref:Rpn family recombination-promoting nuclease/putative transposase n=1 Tax=Halorhodospira neutriphila TaxID=168379 RepID=UPI0019044FEB|nr:Rpn family recombination-promoting nuclease/putative transposase [Halorhodospira neutriphila]
MAAQKHDPGYKRLFSQPEMVRELLVDYVREDWVRELDFATLEKQNGSYATEDYRGRHDDVIWRVRWGEDWLYVYLLLEFQSGIDRFMAVRMMTYVGLLYQDLITQGKLTDEGRLPPVLPVVLYNGEPRWSAAADIEELIQYVPGGLEAYRPQMRYLVLDEKALLEQEDSPELRNLVHALFRLEHSRDPQEMLAIIGKLGEWLHQPEQRRLRREFALWVQRVLLRRKPFAEQPPPQGQEIQDLEEVQEMLAERMNQWEKEWEQKGHQKGRQKGRLEGEAKMLARMLEKRFGPLTEQQLERIQSADEDTLWAWSDRVFQADSIDEVLGHEG